jgi:hypothetical protein
MIRKLVLFVIIVLFFPFVFLSFEFVSNFDIRISDFPNSTASVPREGENKVIRVLFIGNSYTYYNNLPHVLVKLAASRNPRNYPHIEARMHVYPGATLQYHCEQGTTLRVIREGNWDYVVLQEQSRLGRPGSLAKAARINAPDVFHKYARLLDAEIRKAGAKTVFLLTWTRKYWPENQVILNIAYKQIAEELKAVLAPVGIAWQEVRKREPGIRLYMDDCSHPAPKGTYAAACVLYAAICRQSPVGFPARVVVRKVNSGGRKIREKFTIELEPSEARLIQEVAAKLVKNRPRLKDMEK